MVEVDLPDPICQLIERTESLLLSSCDAVIAANDAIAEHLRASGATDITVVMNCIDLPPDADPGRVPGQGPDLPILRRQLEPGRFVDEMMQAVRADPGCILVIAGNGRRVQAVKRAAVASERIQFLGYIPQEQVLENVSRCDAVICLMEPSNGNNAIGTPNKMFEAMAYGVPVDRYGGHAQR